MEKQFMLHSTVVNGIHILLLVIHPFNDSSQFSPAPSMQKANPGMCRMPDNACNVPCRDGMRIWCRW